MSTYPKGTTRVQWVFMTAPAPVFRISLPISEALQLARILGRLVSPSGDALYPLYSDLVDVLESNGIPVPQ